MEFCTIFFASWITHILFFSYIFFFNYIAFVQVSKSKLSYLLEMFAILFLNIIMLAMLSCFFYIHTHSQKMEWLRQSPKNNFYLVCSIILLHIFQNQMKSISKSRYSLYAHTECNVSFLVQPKCLQLSPLWSVFITISFILFFGWLVAWTVGGRNKKKLAAVKQSSCSNKTICCTILVSVFCRCFHGIA